MLIKIDKKDRDALAHTCASANVRVEFFTIEHNDEMLLAEIHNCNPTIAFTLGRMMQIRIDQLELWKINL